MKPNQLASLTLRLLGIYCVIESIPILSMFEVFILYSKQLTSGNSSSALIASLLPGVCMLVTGILLICFATPLGKKLALSVETDMNGSSISFEEVQVLAFAVAGVLIFAGALPQLIHSVSYLLRWATAGKNDLERSSAYTTYNFREGTSALGTVLKAILGFGLFFRARGFACFWRSLRSFGTPKPPQA